MFPQSAAAVQLAAISDDEEPAARGLRDCPMLCHHRRTLSTAKDAVSWSIPTLTQLSYDPNTKNRIKEVVDQLSGESCGSLDLESASFLSHFWVGIASEPAFGHPTRSRSSSARPGGADTSLDQDPRHSKANPAALPSSES